MSEPENSSDEIVAVNLQNDASVYEENENDKVVQTDVDSVHVENLLKQLMNKNLLFARLEKKIKYLSWTEETFINDDKKLLHFTGLQNMSVFKIILEYIGSSLSAIKVQKLTNFQKLLLTLMKLRSNPTFTELGYRFGE